MKFPLIKEDTALSISLTSQSSTRSGFCKARHSKINGHRTSRSNIWKFAQKWSHTYSWI